MTKKMFPVATLAFAMVMPPRLAAQVQTEIPPVVAGAKPVFVEHIKIHGEALVGNLRMRRWPRCDRIPASQLSSEQRASITQARVFASRGAEAFFEINAL